MARAPLSMRVVSIALMSLLLAACLEDGTGRGANIALRDVVTPDGNALSQACTPSGLEMCFDAVDNNCNGVIDEGCGLHTGILQFVVAWDAPEADINLEVTDAAGELAQTAEATSGGLYKDRDCPRDGGQCYGQNVENVYLVGGEPQKGRYRAVVKLEKLGGATAPVHVRLGVRVGQRSYAMSFELSPGDKVNEKSFEFTL